MKVFENRTGVEVTRCVMSVYWGVPLCSHHDFIKNYNVVQLTPDGHELLLPVLGPSPLGPEIYSAQAVLSSSNWTSSFRPFVDQHISDLTARTLFRQMEMSYSTDTIATTIT